MRIYEPTMPEAPVLVLLGPSAASPGAAGMPRGLDGDPIILGLSLIQRTALAAQRAGYAQVFLLGSLLLGVTRNGARNRPRRRLDKPRCGAPHRSPDVADHCACRHSRGRRLARTAGLSTDRAGGWGTIPNRVVVVAPSSAADAAAELGKDGGARGLADVEIQLARRFGPRAPISADIDPMIVERPSDVSVAERRLLKSLVKDTDGFMARHFERPISLQISRRLAGTGITPNQMSLISIAVGICGGPFFLSPRPLLQTIGALLFLAHSILDGCDGELARLKFQQSRWGGVLDFWGDNVVHSVIFACMGVGWSLEADSLWPLALGVGAVLGTLGSAGFVYWRLMRSKDGGDTLFTSVSDAPERPLTRLLDSASRRDFIYLVILLALFGRSNWFLVMAGIGAPIYFFLVLFAARPQANLGGSGPRIAPGANR